MVHIIKDHDQKIVCFLYLKHLKKYPIMTVYHLTLLHILQFLLKFVHYYWREQFKVKSERNLSVDIQLQITLPS